MDRGRLEAFSDGVIAVAITLLALDLTVAGPGHGHLVHQLHDKWPAFVAYLISFFTIGIIWVNHHALVRTIKDGGPDAAVPEPGAAAVRGAIPFATATVADYLSVPNDDTPVAMMLYGGVFLGMSAGFGAIFEWTLHGQRVYQPLPAEQHWAARGRFVGGGLVYAVSIVVAFFSAVASFVIIGLVAVYYIFERTPAVPDPPDGGDEEPVV